MLPELRDFLVESATPDQLDLIEGATSALGTIGLEQYQEGYLDILMTNESFDAGESVQAIFNLTEQMLRSVLKEHGVVCVDDTDIEVQTKLVEGIVALQNYEMAQDLIDCVQEDQTSEEIFANMLRLVTEYYPEQFLTQLAFVNPYLIKKIKELAQGQHEDEVDYVDAPPLHTVEQTRNIQRYIRFMENTELDVIRHVRAGLRLGYPFDVYIRAMELDLEQLEPKRVAQELVALALISGDAQAAPSEFVKENIDRFISSIDKITQIQIALNDILVRFERYE